MRVNEFYQAQSPECIDSPNLIAFNHELSDFLNLNIDKENEANIAGIFAGNDLDSLGLIPVALAYAGHQFGQFVPELGESLIDLLAPVAGERILDLGCGNGDLTEKIAASGASVLGIDADAGFVDATSAKGLEAQQVDGQKMLFDEQEEIFHILKIFKYFGKIFNI